MQLMIMGTQRVGKGTQAALLWGDLRIPHISTGDLFRNQVNARTKLGQLAANYIQRGELVPDEVTNSMVADRLSAPDTAGGYLLDGFPRTVDQAQWLVGVPGARQGLPGVVVPAAPEPELLARLLLRGRQDDTPDVVRRRLQIYRETTQPLLDHYAVLLVPIDGTGNIADVHARILAALKERLNLSRSTSAGPGPGARSAAPAPLWPRQGWAPATDTQRLRAIDYQQLQRPESNRGM